MRLPTVEKDYWSLVSGEERHAQHPDSFCIPSAEVRGALVVGQAAKLIFLIELESEDGTVVNDTERMWVVVSDLVPPYYIGRLTNMPCTVSEDSGFYLKVGAEVPFLAEHVIDVQQPPEEFVQQTLSGDPTGVWPRS